MKRNAEIGLLTKPSILTASAGLWYPWSFSIRCWRG